MKRLFRQKLYPVFIILIFAGVCPLSAESGMRVLATNSWTAAFVRMAGAETVGCSIEQLAPADMVHPPEYELIPSDVKRVRDADFLVFAGYEVLMKTVFDSFKKPEEQMVKITTGYAPSVVEKSVLCIAEKLGTLSTAERNLAEYNSEIAAARNKLKAAGLYGAPVLVHFHQKPLAQTLGFEILGVFGPQPLEVHQIAELGRMKPALIIDNAHNPTSAPLEEIIGMEAVELINFPGFPNKDGTVSPNSLTKVMKTNIERLLTAN